MLRTMRHPGVETEGLQRLVGLLPLGGSVVEVGCYAGESARLWLARAKKYIGVDPWVDYKDVADGTDASEHEMRAAEAAFDVVLAQFAGKGLKYKMKSLAAADLLMWCKLDAIYLDGLHDYRNVVADLRAWGPLVRAGGMLCGHDHNRNGFQEVVAAVRDELGGPDEVFADTSWMKLVP